ncbi:MAG: phosphoenolpyruvate--protein phosphotransferase [Thiotrichaceae bacterium]|nr:phosphoenolpyruvate--protein phosphotransferase [Thiotrichaceae bacterium]PCI13725.1 MAG: phosphoenolpyruvate--protein phosphotransferase [Thiotrichales bacterium]
MLKTLRRIVQAVNAAQDLAQASSIIVARVKQAMSADVCSVYLLDQGLQQYILMASDGLNPKSIGTVRFKQGEGLVSLVGETEELLNLDNAPDHPRYRFIAETGEVAFHGFLGLPIIHRRQVMGVLVVRQRSLRCFDENEVSFLLTIAAQLAGAIAHADARGEIQPFTEAPGGKHNRPIIALSGAPGVGIGTAVVVYPVADLDAVPHRKAKDMAAEILAFEQALAAARAHIKVLETSIHPELGAESRALFEAYLLMLNSDTLVEKTIKRIRDGSWAPGAWRDTINEQAQLFESMDDPYLRERADDVRDLGRRILAHLQNEVRGQPDYPEKTILVGDDISATMLAEVPRERLVGIVSARGSSSSHVAILAHAMGVPAVVGADDLPVARIDGCELVVDGYRGRIFVSPSSAVRDEFTRLAEEEKELVAGLEGLRELPAETLDGVHLPLFANTGLLSDIGPSVESGAEGIGLYRTEFPFMIREYFPGEEEQCAIYREVLEGFAPRPVTLRTLDVGGDKALSYFPIEEENPFLGWRGIRITLDHPEIFLVQLRAMMRANIGLNNLHLMLPMISNVAEVDRALQLIGRAHQELLAAGETVVMPKVGIMVEVPAVIYLMEVLASRVDFFSVGTNDLTQYLLAVDRNNPRVASLYDSLHPAVLRALIQIIAAANLAGKPVSICGEVAGDPVATLLLLGMGVSSLSMSAASMLRVKSVIRSFTMSDARSVLDEALQYDDAATIRDYLERTLEKQGLGGLVRAGK